MNDQQRLHARQLLEDFKGDAYVFGRRCFDRLGEHVRPIGKRVSVVASGVGKPWGEALHAETLATLEGAGLRPTGELIPGAAPNSPREDVYRVAEQIGRQDPDVVLCVGGGSNIDGAKASLCWLALGDRYENLDDYFGVGRVSDMLGKSHRSLKPMVACQIAAGSGAHLTKYSNITDTATSQKLLIIDQAVTPQRALFDYEKTVTMSPDFTMDGALDGLTHCLEVYMGIDAGRLGQVEPVALSGIELIVEHLGRAVQDGDDLDAREAIGLGTDLGGYAIMIGGTNGAHLTSFSLVDLLPHGRATALMEPYYMVFFAPAIEDRLRRVADVYRRAGLFESDPAALGGRELGVALAEAMQTLSRQIGFPTTLSEVEGFDADTHLPRALEAAKSPALESKLQNMPIPLSAETVEQYMGPILQAAMNGDFEKIVSPA